MCIKQKLVLGFLAVSTIFTHIAFKQSFFVCLGIVAFVFAAENLAVMAALISTHCVMIYKGTMTENVQ